MTGDLVSVVMPARDEEPFIAEAIESVLAQSHRSVELIVVDDGSSDRTAEIAEGYWVRVLRRSHRGAAAAQNAGLAVARGTFWTVFDADDVMPLERLAHQVSCLNRQPDLGIVLGLTEAFVNPGEPRPAHYNPAWDDGPFPACAGTLMARRSVLDLVGAFDEDLPLAYDIEWLARAKDGAVKAGLLDDVCLRYRIHSGNVTADSSAVHLAMLRVLRGSVRRGRARCVAD
jgi:glycosyltransferase involved in cell wall biosynthesis